MATEPLGRLAAALRAVAAELARLDYRWALVGGLAVSARAEPRFTRDIDIAMAVTSDEDSEGIVNALLVRGYRLLASLEQDQTGRLATVRLQYPGEDAIGIVVDLLFASSGIEPEIVAAADDLDVLPESPWPVAKLGHLLATKVLSQSDRRPQDRADIAALLAHADGPALELARQAARLIDERGYARGRDLAGDLERFIQEGAFDSDS